MTSGLDRWLWYSVRRAELDKELARLSERFQGRVLEVGAGRHRRGRFAEPAGIRWIRCDLETKCEPNVAADVLALPYRQASFDAVVCLEVLEYVEQPNVAIRQMMGILKPGGLLVVSVPFMHRMDAENDMHRWTAEGVKRLLRVDGIADLVVTKQGGGLAVIANILKQGACDLSPSWFRWLCTMTLMPVVGSLRLLDGPISRYSPRLSSNATGYVGTCRLQGA